MAFIPQSGSVVSFEGGSWVTSVSGTVGASIIGIPTFQTGVSSVITVAQSSVAVAIVSGSIAASFTPPANQSVSGTIGASIIGIPTVQTGNSSVITLGQGSIAVAIVSGSIAASFTPPANQSVSGTVGASIIGLPNVNVSGSVVGFQGTNPWIITGSVQGSFSPSGNQSVSGTVGASIIGIPTFQTGNTSTISLVQSSVAVAIVSGSIAATFTPPANQSVSGTIGASVIGNVPVVVQSSVAVAIISGSIAATFTPPANQSVSGTIGASVIGNVPVVVQSSVAVAIISGSIAASFTPPANQSVSGTVGASIIGLTPVRLSDGTNVGNVLAQTGGSNSSVLQGAQLVAGSFLEVPYSTTGVAAVAATDVGNYKWVSVHQISTGGSSTTTFQGSNDNTNWVSVALAQPISTVSSPAVSTAANGVFAGPINFRFFRLNVTGIVSGTTSGIIEFFANPTTIMSPGGQVAINGITTVQTGNSSVLTFPTSSTIAVIQGSVAAVQSGTWIPSALGYIERNDTVASFLGADLTYRPMAGDSAGRFLIKPFSADESRLDTVSSAVSTSVTALFNSVVGLRNYVTDIMIANTGSVATLVTFKDGSTSILGFTIAPAGGGSNINGMSFPLRTAPAQDFTYTAATATSVLYVTAKGYKAP